MCGLHLEVFSLFRGCTLRGHYFDGLQAVSRPLCGVFAVQGYSVICYLNILLSARLKRWCALCILEVGCRRGDRHRVIILPDVDVGELRLVDVAAHQGRRHTQLLAGLILGE